MSLPLKRWAERIPGGMVIVPLGYTVHEVYASGGNPYGASYTSGTALPGSLPDETLIVARAQGARLARFA